MPKPNFRAREFLDLYLSEGREGAVQRIREAARRQLRGEPGGLSLKDVSLRDLFAQLVRDRSGQPVGDSFVQEYFSESEDCERLFETGGMASVDSTAFFDITGQLAVVDVLRGYQSEEFIATSLIPDYNTPLREERIPGVALPSDPGEDVTEVPEGKPYPSIGFGSEYIDRPTTVRRGLIIPVSRDAIFFDKTGLVSENANKAGYILGPRKEKRALDLMIGATSIRFIEKRQFDNSAVTMDLFQASSTTWKDATLLAAAGGSIPTTQLVGATYSGRKFPFVNDIPGNALKDYTSFANAERAFAQTVDPSTGEPVVISKGLIFASQSRAFDVPQVIEAINIMKLTQNGLATSEGGIFTTSANPIQRAIGLPNYRLSRQLRAQIVEQLYGGTDDDSSPDKVWFYGDPAQAFRYAVNRPITVTQAPPNSEAEFTQDIVLRFKASERGQYFIRDPRYWQRHNFRLQA